MLRRYFRDRRGVSVTEYGLILAFLSLIIMVGIGRVANELTYLWGNNASKLNSSWSQNADD